MATSENAASAPAGSKKKLWVLVIVAFLLALAIGGGGAYFLLNRNAGDEAAEEEDEPANEKPKRADKSERRDKDKPAREKAAPTYVAMEAFTVNLTPENENSGDQYLHLVVSLEIIDPAVGDKIKTYMPRLRNDVMLFLSSKKPSELASPEGKRKLGSEIRNKINDILEPGSSQDRPEYAPVKEVLFTTLIVQ